MANYLPFNFNPNSIAYLTSGGTATYTGQAGKYVHVSAASYGSGTLTIGSTVVLSTGISFYTDIISAETGELYAIPAGRTGIFYSEFASGTLNIDRIDSGNTVSVTTATEYHVYGGDTINATSMTGFIGVNFTDGFSNPITSEFWVSESVNVVVAGNCTAVVSVFNS